MNHAATAQSPGREATKIETSDRFEKAYSEVYDERKRNQSSQTNQDVIADSVDFPPANDPATRHLLAFLERTVGCPDHEASDSNIFRSVQEHRPIQGVALDGLETGVADDAA